MSLAITEAEVTQLLVEAPFARLYGFQLHSLADGECVLHVPYQTVFARPDGLISGPVYMSAADTALWFAIMTRLGRTDGMATVTVEMQTAFLRGAVAEDVRCRARVLKWGRQLIYGSAECETLTSKLLTHHTLTYIRANAKGA